MDTNDTLNTETRPIEAPKWYYSFDEENYRGDGYTSEEEAVAAALEDDGKPDDLERFWVGEGARPASDEHLDGSLLLDHIVCQDEYMGDHSDAAFRPSVPAVEDLTEKLREMFRNWMTQWDEWPQFYTIPQPYCWRRVESGFEREGLSERDAWSPRGGGPPAAHPKEPELDPDEMTSAERYPRAPIPKAEHLLP